MASNPNTEKISDRPELVDLNTGIELLKKQIEAAKQILKNRPIRSENLAAWNNKTREYLIKIYGAKSPNINTIVMASGNTPVWMGMPQEVGERFEASSIENKIQMLKACIVSLKLKADQFQSKKAELRGS